jgi:hypothetical protein
MKEAFVYSWRNILTNMLYVGWHKGSIDDGYVCSSKKMLEEYKKDPSMFERFIIAHGSCDQMVMLETTILKSVDARNNPSYYNQQNGDGKFTCKHVTDATKAKISASKKGKKNPSLSQRNLINNPGKKLENRKKLGERAKQFIGDKNPNFGRKQSDESRALMSKNRTGKLLGVSKSEETKQKMSEARSLYWKKRKELDHAS